MKKKEILKEQEKLRKERNQVYMDFNNKSDVMKIVKISLGVVLFIGVIFLGINIINGDLNIFSRKNTDIDDSGSNRVMCGTLFDQGKIQYLVLAYDFTSDEADTYLNIKDSYSGAFKFFTMDLHSGFNKTCVGDKTVISDDISKLKLSGPTLLVIENEKIIESYKGKTEIINYLNK